jgi:hypothetical protein
MKYDEAKIDDAVLALLGALQFEPGRVWKRYDFAVMDRLHEAGMIADPHGHQESIFLTEDGLRRSATLAEKMFGVDPK